MNVSISALGLLIVLLVIWVLPVVMVASSRRTEGQAKAIWVLVTLFGSWLGVIAYYVATSGRASESA